MSWNLVLREGCSTYLYVLRYTYEKTLHTELEVMQHRGKTGILPVKITVYFYYIIKNCRDICLHQPF